MVFYLDTGVFQDNAARMQIQRLKVHCPHKSKGCSWTGDLSDRSSHLRLCPHSIRSCDYCSDRIQVSELVKHIETCPKAPVSCQYCNSTWPRDKLDNHRDKHCPKAPVKCPNSCHDDSLIREAISMHCSNECSRQPVPCPLESFGCLDKIPREDIPTHVKECALEHLSMLALLVLEQSKEIDSLKRLLASQRQSLTSMENTCYPLQPRFTWKIDDIKGRIKMAQTTPKSPPIYSPAFYTGEGGYKLGLCVYPAGDSNHECMSLYFLVMRGPFDDILPWPFQRPVCLLLINCRGGPNLVKEFYPDPRLHYFKKPTEPRNVGFGYSRFIPVVTLLNEEAGYTSNGSIFIRVMVS